jgi:hypothetical protein
MVANLCYATALNHTVLGYVRVSTSITLLNKLILNLLVNLKVKAKLNLNSVLR